MQVTGSIDEIRNMKAEKRSLQNLTEMPPQFGYDHLSVVKMCTFHHLQVRCTPINVVNGTITPTLEYDFIILNRKCKYV